MLYSFGSSFGASGQIIPKIGVLYTETISTGTTFNFSFFSGKPVKDRVLIIAMSAYSASTTNQNSTLTLSGNTVTKRIQTTTAHATQGGATTLALWSCVTTDGGVLSFVGNHSLSNVQTAVTVYEMLGYAGDSPIINSTGFGTTSLTMQTNDSDVIFGLACADISTGPGTPWNNPMSNDNGLIGRNSTHGFATKFSGGTNTTFTTIVPSDGTIGLRWAKKRRV